MNILNGQLATIKNSQISHQNLAGVPSLFNPEGRRMFSLRITEEESTILIASGWTVKIGLDEEMNDVSYLPVRLVEGFWQFLSVPDLRDVTLKLYGLPYEYQGRNGIAAYLAAIED